MAFKKKISSIVKEEIVVPRIIKTSEDAIRLADFFTRNKNYNPNPVSVDYNRIKYVIMTDEFETDEAFRERMNRKRDRLISVVETHQRNLETFNKEYNETFIEDESESRD